MKKAIIYRAGGNYIRFAGYLKERYEIVALVDGNENAWGSCCEGLEIEPPAVITDRQYDLVIVTPNDSAQIAGSLREKYSISEERMQNFILILKAGLYI